jgi:transcriptional regulator
MYIPSANRIEDKTRINAFIQSNGFSTVVTRNEEQLWASHLPVLFEEATEGHGILRSHMARANEQWRHFESAQEVLCIFHGPHSYISPSSYVMQETVPTWNYAVVHVYGIANVVEEATVLRKIVTDTTAKYESRRQAPWKITLPDTAMDAMLKAIVGFTIEITRIEAKFKLAQNRSQADQDGMLRDLQASSDLGSRELANFISAQNATAKTEVSKNDLRPAPCSQSP